MVVPSGMLGEELEDELDLLFSRSGDGEDRTRILTHQRLMASR
jgi:hypothetical protein